MRTLAELASQITLVKPVAERKQRKKMMDIMTKDKEKISSDIVYKYYSPTEYNLDALINRYFWFSKRSALNDPYDMNLQVLEVFQKFKELLNDHGYDLEAYNKTLNDFAICCFTKRPENQHFWSLYAGNFQGWCLEFEQDNLVNPAGGVPNKLHDVIYLDEVPNLDDKYQHLEIEKNEDGSSRSETIVGLLYNEKTQEELFTYLLRIKNRDIWSAEEECRLILGNIYLMTHKQHNNAGYRIPWKENALKRIIIGYRMPEYLRKIILMFAKENSVPVSVATPDLQNRQFTIKIEQIEPIKI